MLRRPFCNWLSIWLILSIIGYGVAIAADTHYLLSSTESQTVITDDANQFDNADQLKFDNESVGDYDHCCHGMTHLIGLHNAIDFSLSDSQDTQFSLVFASFITFLPTTPLRPPINT